MKVDYFLFLILIYISLAALAEPALLKEGIKALQPYWAAQGRWDLIARGGSALNIN